MLTYLIIIVATYCSIRLMEIVLDRVTPDRNDQIDGFIAVFGGIGVVVIILCTLAVFSISSTVSSNLNNL